MSFINVLVLLLLIVGCVASPAEHKPTLPPPDTLVNAPEVAIPEDLREQVKRAEEIGRQLYYLDKVAAIATDVLLEHIGQSGTKEIAGYLPFRESDGEGQPAESWRVIFFSTEDNPRINYEVRVFAKVGRVTEFSKMDPPRNPPQLFSPCFE